MMLITGSACEDPYVETQSAQAYGGLQVIIANTVDLCRRACNANSSCVAFDFNQDRQCYLHIGQNQIRPENVNLNAVGVNHYRRTFTCGPGAPTTGSCFCFSFSV